MKVRALISFGGLFSMTQGEVADVKDEYILNDLLQAKFVEEIKSKDKTKGKAKIDEGIGAELSDD